MIPSRAGTVKANERCRVLRLILPWMMLVPVTGCSVFEWSRYDSFGEWYVGPAGFTHAMEGESSREGLLVSRPPIYGHFRLPELLIQPAGGWTYPKRITITNSSLVDAINAGLEAQRQADMYGHGTASYMRVTEREDGPENSVFFDWWDAGIVEIIPYRTWASDEGVGYKIGITLLQPLNSTMTALYSLIIRGPCYIVHDSLKTVTIPFAGIYYASRGSDADEPEAEEGGAGDEEQSTESPDP